MGTRRWTRNLAAILVVAVVLAACSCSSSDDDADPTPTTPTTSPTEAEVKTAYLAYREMVTRLLESPNPGDPEIDQRTAGENHEFLVDRLNTLVASGQALRFAPEHRFDVVDVSVTGNDAVVQDCTVDAASTVNVASGEVVSQGTTTQLLEATLTFDSGWKIRTIRSVREWEGAVQCAE